MWSFSAASVGLPACVGLPCQSHGKPGPCGASLVALLVCHTDHQKADEQPRHPSVHKHPRTSVIKKNIGAEGPVAQRSGNEERRSATPMSSPDTGGPNPSTGDSKKIFLLRSLAARLHSKVTREKMPLEVVGGPCPVRKLRKRSPGA